MAARRLLGRARPWVLCLLLAPSCDGTSDGADSGAPDTAALDAVAPDAASLDAMAPADAMGAGDTARPAIDAAGGDATARPDVGTAPPSCSPPTITSVCGPRGVIRVRAVLPAGSPDQTGALVALLTHYRLGGGDRGGVPHGFDYRAATIGPTNAGEVEVDFCADAGEMWSEENCEFNVIVWLNLDGNMQIDPGEPASRTVVPINCHATESPCIDVVLDCLDGMACMTFEDPGACSCSGSCADVASASRIVLCEPP